jgi:hypothetical protein
MGAKTSIMKTKIAIFITFIAIGLACSTKENVQVPTLDIPD